MSASDTAVRAVGDVGSLGWWEETLFRDFGHLDGWRKFVLGVVLWLRIPHFVVDCLEYPKVSLLGPVLWGGKRERVSITKERFVYRERSVT